MLRPSLRAALPALAVAVALSAATARAQGNPYPVPQQNLFYNFYTPSPYADPGGNAAAMYPAPRPTPPMVGHTYYTYQPMLPHENMYHHHRKYYTYNPGSGITETRVHWCRDKFANFKESWRLVFAAPRDLGFTRSSY